MNKTCKDCTHFIGGGDWNLCCTESHDGYPFGFLCYEDTPACEKFEEEVQNDDMSPTDKQIEFADSIAEVLGIDFPQSSKDFNKFVYYKFIKDHYDDYMQFVDDVNDFNWEDEMSWFQMLNG